MMSVKPEDAVSAVDIAYRQNTDSSFKPLASGPWLIPCLSKQLHWYTRDWYKKQMLVTCKIKHIIFSFLHQNSISLPQLCIVFHTRTRYLPTNRWHSRYINV